MVTRATPSLASVLRVSPALGRWFTEAECATGAASVAVLSHGLWTGRFGGDPGIVGRSISLDGQPAEVIGVMPATFSFPDARSEIWTAAQSTREPRRRSFSASPAWLGCGTVSPSKALVRRSRHSSRTFRVVFRISVPSSRRPSLSTRPSSVALPAHCRSCWHRRVSFACRMRQRCDLFLVRSETRQREVAVRRALGAGRRSIARYFFSESVLLATVGGVLGVALAWGGVRLLVAFGPTNLPRLNEVRVDGVVLAFSFALSLVSAVAFGIIPLLRLTPVATTLQEHGRGQTATRGSHRARQLPMGGQVALALSCSSRQG